MSPNSLSGPITVILVVNVYRVTIAFVCDMRVFVGGGVSALPAVFLVIIMLLVQKKTEHHWLHHWRLYRKITIKFTMFTGLCACNNSGVIWPKLALRASSMCNKSQCCAMCQHSQLCAELVPSDSHDYYLGEINVKIVCSEWKGLHPPTIHLVKSELNLSHMKLTMVCNPNWSHY